MQYTKFYICLAGSFAIISCTSKASVSASKQMDNNTSPIQVHLAGENTVATGQCDPTNPPKDENVKTTVRVYVHSADLSNPSRDVIYSKHVSNEDLADNTPGGTPMIKAIDKQSPDPFEVNIDELPKTPGASYVEIRVILLNNNYSFFNQDGIQGVGVGDKHNNAILCGASIAPHAPRPTVVLFTTLGKPHVENPNVGGYNIGLTPAKASETPIFIDPKIQNNG